ncbi:MAG TPA: NrdH-redoxin [Actinobacteria bacterium]|nr:NrdH-redoxin [Actinomycetota bacterium]HCP60900.1 NrdH-redoxin [Actinomycetota bacterium]
MAGVRMFSRRSCHLCDDARAIIQAERSRRAFDFEEIFIDGDEGLERTYGLRVPVVEVDGTEEFEYRVEPARFHELLGRL